MSNNDALLIMLYCLIASIICIMLIGFISYRLLDRVEKLLSKIIIMLVAIGLSALSVVASLYIYTLIMDKLEAIIIH